jgi:hypothetical protein
VIEMGKEYRTRSGGLVRLYTVQGARRDQPIVGEMFVSESWQTSTWDTRGRWSLDGVEHRLDLIEVKPVRVFERWVNVYRCGLYTWHSRRYVADQFAADRIACLHIRQEYREGDGLCDSEKT